MSWKIGVLLASFGVRSAVGGRSQIFALVMTSREEFSRAASPTNCRATPVPSTSSFPFDPRLTVRSLTTRPRRTRQYVVVP